MHLVADLVVAAGAQLGVGALALAAVARALGSRHPRRARQAVWRRAARALAGPGIAGGALAAGTWVTLWVAAPEVAQPTFWVRPAGLVVAGAIPAAGCFLLLDAARREARGRWAAARREVRLGGKLLAPAIVVLLVYVWADLLALGGFRRAVTRDVPWAGVLLVSGMLLVGCASFIGLLAGLSGKPRPAGWFAVAFYAAGLAGLVAAAHRVLAAAG